MKPFNNIIRSCLILSLLLSLAVLPLSTALAYSAGPNNPGLGSNVNDLGTEAWVTPEGITAPGTPFASVPIVHNFLYSNYLQGSQYGFSVPSDAAILGIEVSISRMYTGRPNILDNVVSLVKTDGITGENKASPLAWPAAFETMTYGGPEDLWGTTWTPDEVNSPNFGVVLAVYRNNNGNPASAAYVDTLQVSVYYGYDASTAVVCGDETPITYGDSVACVATLSKPGSDLTPTGTVDWISDGNGSFDPNPCTLEGAQGVATCTATYTPAAVGSGLHLITATYSGDEYFSPSDASAEVTVLARPVTATADPQTKVYGENEPEFTFQITEGSLVFSDTFTGTLTRDPGENAGAYPILQGTLALPDNYVLTYVGDYLTIEKADPVCTVTEYDVIYDGNEYTATGSCTGVFGEELLGLDLSGTAHMDVGVYANDAWTYTDVTGNYNDLTGVITDTISLRPITVQADPQTKVAGQPDPELTYQVTDGSLLVGDEITGTLTRQPGEMPGTYPILQGTLSLPDYYEITYLSADLTITGYMLALPMVYR